MMTLPWPGRVGLALLCALATPVVWPAIAAAPASFEQLMAEAELVFDPPADFIDLPAEAHPLLAYEHALRHADGLLEIRYAVRPLERVRIDYEDPHGAAPEPNHLFPLLFDSITQRLAGTGHSPRREYPAQRAREMFNADWAAVSVFDLEPGFSARYRQGLLVAMHRNGKADAYVVCLYNDYAAIKPLLENAMSSLRFAP